MTTIMSNKNYSDKILKLISWRYLAMNYTVIDVQVNQGAQGPGAVSKTAFVCFGIPIIKVNFVSLKQEFLF